MESFKLKIFIVDDEPKAIETLEFMLASIPMASLVGSATSVDEAIPLIIQTQPDFLLLDIVMPDKDGFKLIEELHRLEFYPHIVFITGHESYAIKAVRCAAFDYLLKPVHPDELASLIQRALSHQQNHKLPEKIDYLLTQLKKQKRIRFNTRSGFIMVDPDDITYIDADWNYSTIFLCTNKQEVVTLNIGKVEQMLPSSRFFRINRSIIINLDHLVMVDRKKKICIVDFDNTEKVFNMPRHKIRVLDTLLSSNREFL